MQLQEYTNAHKRKHPLIWFFVNVEEKIRLSILKLFIKREGKEGLIQDIELLTNK